LSGGGRTLTVPGCWDGFTALMIERTGYEAAFLSGAALSMAKLGRPDIGLVTSLETCDSVASIRDRIELPLIVDGDTGFGNGLNVQRTTRLVERAGATALQIEDQGFPKRCGFMSGKSIVPLAEAVGRIKAALDARDAMLIIARTDALAIEGIEAALERAEAFREAGADMIFVEGLATPEEFERVTTAFGGRVPLVHNMLSAGSNFAQVMATLQRSGFAIALHPLILLQALAQIGPSLLRSLGAGEPIAGDLPSLERLNEMLGADALIAAGSLYGG
jgi:2-methylisocitrate lyase-like PEP mutase family enzyme